MAGSYFVQVQELPWEAFVCAVPGGLLASAILVVNNVRDLETDRRAGKRTLAVRLGRARTRTLYAGMVEGAFLTAPLPWLLGVARRVLADQRRAQGRRNALIEHIAETAMETSDDHAEALAARELVLAGAG